MRVSLLFYSFLAAMLAGPAAVMAMDNNQAAAVSRPVAGGAFSLVDHNARQVTDKDFRGKYMLLYFGYTFCPDVCPTGLTIMSEAVETLGRAGEKVTPVFVTVDPERDTLEAMARYVVHFHPRLVGLRGSLKQTKTAARAYGVKYFKVFEMPFDDDGEESGEDENSRYSMDHSANIYLVGPGGKLLAIFPYGMEAAPMSAKIRHFINNEK